MHASAKVLQEYDRLMKISHWDETYCEPCNNALTTMVSSDRTALSYDPRSTFEAFALDMHQRGYRG